MAGVLRASLDILRRKLTLTAVSLNRFKNILPASDKFSRRCVEPARPRLLRSAIPAQKLCRIFARLRWYSKAVLAAIHVERRVDRKMIAFVDHRGVEPAV